MSTTIEALVAAFVPAFRSGRALPAGALDALNVSTAEAYAAQASLCRALGGSVAGWKVGFGPDAASTAAPLLAAGVQPSGGRFALPPDRPLLVEIEIAFRLGRDLPPRPARPYSRGEVEDAVVQVFCGAELLAPRSGMPSAGTPFPRFIVDLHGNCGYVVGNGTAAYRAIDLSACRTRIRVGRSKVHDAVGGHPQGDPWAPVVAWANAQCDGLGGLKAGQILTTGSLHKPIAIEGAARIRAEVEGVGEVALDIVRGR
ncbi:MAG: hypothetical protein U1F51_20050 [Burkholderiales bacterium]